MKNKFTKFTPILLIAVILPMAGGFCFQSFGNQAPTASAAPSTAVEKQLADMDNCSNEATPAQPTPPIKAAPVAPHHSNSLLPCCVDGAQPSVVTVSRSTEIVKFPLALLFIASPTPRALPAKIIYQARISAPPDLLALKTTILRL